MEDESSIDGLGTDFLFLKHVSRILRHYWDVLKVCTFLPSSLWVLPLGPTQCWHTGLKMRNKKWKITVHPSNVLDSYFRALDFGCLFEGKGKSLRESNLHRSEGYHSSLSPRVSRQFLDMAKYFAFRPISIRFQISHAGPRLLHHVSLSPPHLLGIWWVWGIPRLPPRGYLLISLSNQSLGTSSQNLTKQRKLDQKNHWWHLFWYIYLRMLIRRFKPTLKHF